MNGRRDREDGVKNAERHGRTKGGPRLCELSLRGSLVPHQEICVGVDTFGRDDEEV